MTTGQCTSIFARFGLKTTSSLNTHKNYRCKASTLNFHAQLEKLIFTEVGGPNFWGDRWKNRAKIGKMPRSPRYLGAIFSVPPPPPPQNIRTCLVTYFWHITFTFYCRNQKKLQKTVFLYNFQTIPPTLDLSLSLF